MFVSGLLKVARDFASEIKPYTLFSGDLKYLFGSGMIRIRGFKSGVMNSLLLFFRGEMWQ